MSALIKAVNVSKRFMLYHNRSTSLKERFLGIIHRDKRQVTEAFWALKNVSFAVGPGEALGLIGRNGSGKSTLLKLIAGIHRPTTGDMIVAEGSQIGTMIELGLGFHPELSGTENVFLSASIHGLTRGEIEDIYDHIVDYSGLHHFMDVQLKNYSSGMHMRLAFAIMANLDPDVLLLDEIFAVGDEDFQKKCARTMEQFAARGKTIIFVSHAPTSVTAICQRVIVLDRGALLFDGGTAAGIDEYHRLLAGSPS
jgi:ABC-type polysaccharide/polyol phosphate transport system ATPase subunit